MASIITHIAIPCAIRLMAGKKNIPTLLLFYACVASILPDFDVISFKLGIPYESDFGHRGFTHSIVFALFVALLGMLFSRYFQCKKRVAFSVLFISTVSHPLLDALTNGGHGVALWWPFVSDRLFLPWQPIEVSPIGIKLFFSEWGLRVLRSELITVWLPCLSVVALYHLLVSLFIKKREQ